MLLRQSDSLKTYNRKSFIPSYRLTVTYTEIVYPARILPNQTAKPVPETQKLAECIYDCRTLLQQILTDGLTVLQNSKNPAPSYQQHKAGLSKAISSNFLFYFFFLFFFFFTFWYILVFCYQNCSDLLWDKNVLVIKKKLLKFKAEGREFAKFLYQ